MVTYDFYLNTYLGQEIPERYFAGCLVQAEAALQYLERICTVQGGETSRAMALCAMAEAVYAQRRQGNVRAASAGEMSVQYQSPGEQNRELYKRAGIYLEIYRGKDV